MKELVILDLDGIIIKGQSQQIFLNYLFRKKIVGLLFYLRINLWFILYKLGFLKKHETIVGIMKNSKQTRIHAKQRAVQRYGVIISERKRREIINLIHSGKTVQFVKRHSVRVTEWEIPFDGETFRVLYDKKRKDIATFLPPKDRD